MPEWTRSALLPTKAAAKKNSNYNKNNKKTISDKEVMLIDRMGSICSSANSNNNNASLPPKDLGELLQQAEKVRLLDHKSLCSAMCRRFMN